VHGKNRTLGQRRLLMGMFLCLAPVTLFAAEKPPKPDRIPSPATTAQQALIRQGVAPHDAGDFEGAIARYEQVLAESPGNVEALYELAFSHAARKDCMKAMTVGRQGAQYRSDLLPRFHMLLGNCLDDLGMRDEAIDLYKAAIKAAPGFALLHYNLGFTYVRAGKLDEARRELQQALYLDPDHASSHYLLSAVYEQLGYRVPAILGLSRFLSLEPASTRTKDVLLRLNSLLSANVTKGENSNNLNITLSLSPNSKKDEGDFDSVALALSFSLAASQMVAEKKESSPFQLMSTNYALISDLLSRTDGKGFAVDYYAPFFAELDKKEFVEAFVYHAFTSARLPGATEWAEQNAAKLTDYQQWLSAYRWPSKK